MIALCVDDETLLLADLKRAVEKSPDITQAVAFDDAIEAAEWAADHRFDIAFLDVRMPVMGGLELAAKLHRDNPGLPVVFCTGYREYALDAFAVQASGYLLKPVRAEKVQQVIDHIKAIKADTADFLLTVCPCGIFTVQDKYGQELGFKRKKEKELFAALIHLNGAEITTDGLCDMLWEDNAWMYEKNKQYIYTLFSFLRGTLREAGAEEVLRKEAGGYCLDMSRIRIDNSTAEGQEYMPGYAWSKE